MKLILAGACGRMGREVTAMAGEDIVYGVDLSPAPMPYPVYPTLRERGEADIFMDFSCANGIEERLDWCVREGVPAVLAATGYSEAQFKAIGNAAKRIAVFQTGNFSLGVALLCHFAKKAAAFLGDGFDAEIIERHHNQKKDAPSGTALMLLNSVKQGYGGGRGVFGRQGVTGERKSDEIGVHAVRGGTIVGEHEVMFAGDDEIITLSHSARSRKVFAVGALKAAKWLLGKPASLYNMDDLVRELL